MRKLSLFIFLASTICLAQTNTISFTVKDTAGVQWPYATWSIDLYNPSGGQRPININSGQPVITHYAGTLPSTALLSQLVTPNADIVPSGTSYIITICPIAGPNVPCQQIGPYVDSVSSSRWTQNLKPIQIVASFNMYGYNPNEIIGTPLLGSVFWDNTLGNGSYCYTYLPLQAPCIQQLNPFSFAGVILSNGSTFISQNPLSINFGGTGAQTASGAVANIVNGNNISPSVVTAGQLNSGMVNGVYYPAQCASSTNRPSWCSGSDIGGWINSAFANSSAIVVASGTYSVNTQIIVPSNGSILCEPGTTLQASNTIASTLILFTSATNAKIQGCIIEGNTSNPTNIDLIDTVSSNDISILHNHLTANKSRMINIVGSSNIHIRDNEIDHFGNPLPAANNNEGVSIAPTSGSANMSNLFITHNFIHDGNIGIGVYPVNQTISNIQINNNFIYSNANDGVLFYGGSSAGNIIGANVSNNFSYCNGWPGSVTNWNSVNCPPGYLQNGTTASSSGAGIDLNSPFAYQPTANGNVLHDNYFEGMDATFQLDTVVNTSGTSVTYVSGTNFNSAWKTGQYVSIAGTNYQISSVTSATAMVLSASAGTQTGVTMVTSAMSRGSFSGNVAYNNGNGRTSTSASGHGFANIGYGNTWSANVSYNNVGNGFVDQLSVLTTHTGDTAYNNNSLGGPNNAGFNESGGIYAQFVNVAADDNTTAKYQYWGLILTGSEENNVLDSSLCGTNGCGINAVLGSANNYVSVFGQSSNNYCFANGGGVGCVNYGGGSGYYTLNLPAQNGTLVTTSELPVTVPLTTTAATSDTVTVSGLTTAGHCWYVPTNSVSAGFTGVYIDTPAAGSVTINHPAVAGGIFSITCTLTY